MNEAVEGDSCTIRQLGFSCNMDANSSTEDIDNS